MGACKSSSPTVRRTAGARRGCGPAADARGRGSRPRSSGQCRQSGTLPLPRLEEAAQRVVTMITWRARTLAPQGAAPGSGSALSQRVSAAAVTVLAGPCRAAMGPGSVRLAGGSEQDRARFVHSARAAAITVGAGPLVTLIGYESRRPTAASWWPLTHRGHWRARQHRPSWHCTRSQEAFNALAAVLRERRPPPAPVAVGPFAPGSGC